MDEEGIQRAVPRVEGIRMSHDMHSAVYFETSALTGKCVADVFEEGKYKDVLFGSTLWLASILIYLRPPSPL